MTASATSPRVRSQSSWTDWRFIRGIRLKSRSVDFVVGGIDGFIRHKTKRHAALLAHYGFLSVFPLLVVMTTILGYALENTPRFRTEIVDSVFARIPFIGEQIKQDPSQIHGNLLVLVFGLATALWAGTRAFVAAQNGMNDIWEIPESQRPTFVQSRGRALLAIVVVGVAQIGSVIVTGIVGVSGTSWLHRILLIVAAVAINIAVLLAAYKVLTARTLTLHQLLPGAVFAGLAFSVLQLIGTTVVQRAIRSATPVYGTFATVIALLSWLSFHALIALIGAEANAALARHRAPRTARGRS
jgi:membrane protein